MSILVYVLVGLLHAVVSQFCSRSEEATASFTWNDQRGLVEIDVRCQGPMQLYDIVDGKLVPVDPWKVP